MKKCRERLVEAVCLTASSEAAGWQGLLAFFNDHAEDLRSYFQITTAVGTSWFAIGFAGIQVDLRDGKVSGADNALIDVSKEDRCHLLDPAYHLNFWQKQTVNRASGDP